MKAILVAGLRDLSAERLTLFDILFWVSKRFLDILDIFAILARVLRIEVLYFCIETF